MTRIQQPPIVLTKVVNSANTQMMIAVTMNEYITDRSGRCRLGMRKIWVTVPASAKSGFCNESVAVLICILLVYFRRRHSNEEVKVIMKANGK
jgi:hypothetical protein